MLLQHFMLAVARRFFDAHPDRDYIEASIGQASLFDATEEVNDFCVHSLLCLVVVEFNATIHLTGPVEDPKVTARALADVAEHIKLAGIPEKHRQKSIKGKGVHLTPLFVFMALYKDKSQTFREFAVEQNVPFETMSAQMKAELPFPDLTPINADIVILDQLTRHRN